MMKNIHRSCSIGGRCDGWEARTGLDGLARSCQTGVMPPKNNPLKLNPLQLRTLVILQALARDSAAARKGPGAGEVTVERFPQAHGSHFHIGNASVSGKDASGLYNDKVWHALERKGLARADWPHNIALTAAGLAYDTGLAHEILGPSPH